MHQHFYRYTFVSDQRYKPYPTSVAHNKSDRPTDCTPLMIARRVCLPEKKFLLTQSIKTIIMKSVNINNIVKIVFFTAVIALFTFGTVLTANAQESGNKENVEIKYLGAVGNNPIFQVEFDNLEEEELFITLKDSDGNMLYSEKFKEKKFSKKFQVERADEDLRVILTIANKKGKFSQQYQINRNTRIVQDVFVTKVR